MTRALVVVVVAVALMMSVPHARLRVNYKYLHLVSGENTKTQINARRDKMEARVTS